MRILQGLRNLGVLSVRPNFSKLLEKARRLCDIDQVPAAYSCLKEGLDGISEGDWEREGPDYAACHILMADCQVNWGLLRGDLPSVRAGLEMLLRVEARFPDYVTTHPRAWTDVIRGVDEYVDAVLDRDWRPGADKASFRSVVGRLALAWSALDDWEAANRVFDRAREAFPADPNLLFWQAEVAVNQGHWERGLALLKESMASELVPGSPAEALALLERMLRSGHPGIEGEVEAIKGEVLRRAGRWDEALASFGRAQERLQGDLPHFAVEGLLLGALRRNQYVEVEHYGAFYGSRGFGTERMTQVAAAVRLALERAPERKHLWLLWSQLCLHLGRLGESLQGVARALGLDGGLAECVLAGCRSVESPAVESPTFRLGLARVMLASGDAERSLEALRWFDAGAPSVEDQRSAAELCREIVGRDPACLAARELLVRLSVRCGALDEALANGRLVLEQTGDIEAAAALSWRVGGASQITTDREAGEAAREFEVDVWIRSGDVEAAFEAVQVVCSHPQVSRSALLRARERLELLARAGLQGPRLRLTLARVGAALGEVEAAAEGFLGLVRSAVEPAIHDPACQGLAQILSALPDPEKGARELATAWLDRGGVTYASGVQQPSWIGDVVAVLAASRSPMARDVVARLQRSTGDSRSPEAVDETGIEAVVAAAATPSPGSSPSRSNSESESKRESGSKSKSKSESESSDQDASGGASVRTVPAGEILPVGPALTVGDGRPSGEADAALVSAPAGAESGGSTPIPPLSRRRSLREVLAEELVEVDGGLPALSVAPTRRGAEGEVPVGSEPRRRVRPERDASGRLLSPRERHRALLNELCEEAAPEGFSASDVSPPRRSDSVPSSLPAAPSVSRRGSTVQGSRLRDMLQQETVEFEPLTRELRRAVGGAAGATDTDAATEN